MEQVLYLNSDRLGYEIMLTVEIENRAGDDPTATILEAFYTDDGNIVHSISDDKLETYLPNLENVLDKAASRYGDEAYNEYLQGLGDRAYDEYKDRD